LPTTIKRYEHQLEAVEKGKDREFFAYLMDPGTGKTRVCLLDLWHGYERGELDAVIVLAPNNVKDQWCKWPHMVNGEDDIDEVTKHLGTHAARIVKGLWISNASGQNKKCWREFEDRISEPNNKFIILATNYEALLIDQYFEFLKEFCKRYRVALVADESTRIGKPGSKRTKRAITLRKIAKRRRILTGTMIVKSPLKAYSQARFLSDNALPFKSFAAFRNRYCVMGGFKNKEVLGYQNLDELGDYIAEWSYRKRKSECLDLPPQIYLPRNVYMTPEQSQAYRTMQEEFFAQIREDEITAKIVLAQMTRLQQITGGYLRTKDGRDIAIIEPSRNPKLQEALHLLEDAPGQVVTWARFRAELEGLRSLLPAGSYFEFHGGIPQKDRDAIKAAFKRGDRPYLLGTESTGGIGINQFVGADQVIHISSDFDTEKRIQADDRNHRIGSEHHTSITYYDIIVPNTVDVKVLRIMREDTKLSAKVLKENWREWV
jgi:SNF2 family DNA or RNA helicase